MAKRDESNSLMRATVGRIVDQSECATNCKVALCPSISSVVTGRKSPNSLYNADLVTFEDGAVDYDHSDAHGFIRLNALRLRVKKMVQDG